MHHKSARISLCWGITYNAGGWCLTSPGELSGASPGTCGRQRSFPPSGKAFRCHTRQTARQHWPASPLPAPGEKGKLVRCGKLVKWGEIGEMGGNWWNGGKLVKWGEIGEMGGNWWNGGKLVKWGEIGEMGGNWWNGGKLVKWGEIGEMGGNWWNGGKLVKWGEIGKMGGNW